MKTYLRLLRFLKPYIWPHFALGMVCMLAYGSSDGVLPYLVQHVINDVFVRKDATTLSYLPLAIILFFAIRGLLNFGQGYLGDYVGLRIINDVRNLLNRHLQSLSVSYFYRNPTGTLISRVNSDVLLLRGTLTDALVSIMRDATSVVVLVVVAFLKDWVLASIAFVVFPASVLPIMRMGKKIKRFTRGARSAPGC